MTRNDSYTDELSLGETLDRVIATYGALPVLLRTLRATLLANRPPPLRHTDDLPDYLRHDVGLDPHARRPPDWIFRL